MITISIKLHERFLFGEDFFNPQIIIFWKFTKQAISLFGEKNIKKITEIGIESISKIDITFIISYI